MTEEGFREREVLRARRDSLERLRAKGIEPFAFSFDVTAHAAELHERFGGIAPQEETGEGCSVAGRIVLRRSHGKLTFLTLRDRSGDIQLLCQENSMSSEGYRLLDDVDLGDIVGATGEVVKTKRGELSVKVGTLTVLTKSLRPLPDKWHGLRDPDLQQRRRYLQLATDLEARTLVEAKANVLKAVRSYLDDHGFLEVETPVLQPTPGGALARPFETHHLALDIDLYLRIALELYLKRLLVGGLERVYEIGRNFRNEGIDRSHNPEFTMLEVYQAYGDYETMMELVTALVRAAALAVRGTLRFEYQGRELDLEGSWPRLSLIDTVSEATGDDVSLDRPDLVDVADRHGVGVDPQWGPGRVVLELYEKLVEPNLW
ncbi:MAG: lysine--tRNA ligase, partial [Actinobacteria bacterium]|nr:lysine--tRNA ligase [Actinomycetota bacterium]